MNRTRRILRLCYPRGISPGDTEHCIGAVPGRSRWLAERDSVRALSSGHSNGHDGPVLPASIDVAPIALHRLVEDHADAIVAGMTASLAELRPWFPWAQGTPTVEDQVVRARESLRSFSEGEDFHFSMIEVASGDLVGGLRVNPSRGPSTAEIGYYVHTDRHRRGYASAATRVAASATFEHLDWIQQVEVRMDVSNTPSIGVAAAAGFVFDREIDRPIMAPAHTGRAQVWIMAR